MAHTVCAICPEFCPGDNDLCRVCQRRLDCGEITANEDGSYTVHE